MGIATALFIVYTLLFFFINYWGIGWMWHLLQLGASGYLLFSEINREKIKNATEEISSALSNPDASFTSGDVSSTALVFFYLFLAIHSLITTVIFLPSFSFESLFFYGITFFYVRACYYYIKKNQPSLLQSIHFNTLKSAPNRLGLLAIAVCLFCMFTPFAEYNYKWSQYTGAMYGYNAITGFGFNQPGYIYQYDVPVTVQGWQLPWGKWISILLCFVAVLMVYESSLKLPKQKRTTFYKIVLILTALWYLFYAKGWNHLGNVWNLLFLVALMAALYFVFGGRKKDHIMAE